MSFRNLPRTSQFVLIANVVAALAAIAIAPRLWMPVPLWQIMLATVVCSVLDSVKLRLGPDHTFSTLGFAGSMGVMVLLGPGISLVVYCLEELSMPAIQGVYHYLRYRERRGINALAVIHGVSNSMVSTFAAAWLYLRIAGDLGFDATGRDVLAALGALVVYFLINSWSVALVLSKPDGPSPLSVWRKDLWDTFPQTALSGACGLLFVAALDGRIGFWVAVSVLAPTILMHHSYVKFYSRMQRDLERTTNLNAVNDALIASLATAIEAKDNCSWRHVHGVRVYAEVLARRMGLTEHEREAVRCAAMVHDIGKIGVPESILSKCGPLTPTEFDQVKKHVEIGASILRPVPFPWPVVDLVYAHHERWDGKGYPNGVAGSAIPIGARILAVADAMETLMSERSYRAPLSEIGARDIIRGGSGTQFDPDVVDALMYVLEECPELRSFLQGDRSEASASPPDCIDNETVMQISRANTEFTTLADRLYRTEQMAYLDPLTSLFNARAMHTFLDDRAAQAALTHKAFTVILVDLDNFKLVNDSLGHMEGDGVLQRVARAMQSCLRPDDVLCRYAGDEFVLIMEQVVPEILAGLRDRLAASVEAVGVEIGLPLGASVGCATLPEDGLNSRDLLDAADRRMYSNKAVRKRSAGH